LQKGGITLEKPEVSYTLFRDMKKYDPTLDENDYNLTTDHTSFSVLQQFRKFCADHPVDVTTWARINPVDIGAYVNPLDDRICFVRDQLNPLLHPSQHTLNEVMIVGSHVTKGMLLPIFPYTRG
jgi:hypothetical protein